MSSPVRRRLRSILVALVAGAAIVRPAAGQAPSGPTAAFGPVFGRLYGGTYSNTSVLGLHAALAVPLHRATPQGVMVLGFTADMFWNGFTDDCVLAPDGDGCLPSAPNLTAITIGWRGLVPGRRNVVYHVAAGRVSGRGEVTGGGLARIEFVPRSDHLGLQAYAQYSFIPSFQDRALQPFLLGISVYVH